MRSWHVRRRIKDGPVRITCENYWKRKARTGGELLFNLLSEAAMNAGFSCYIPACPINRIIYEVAMICHACKQEVKFEEKISRTEECPHCGADVHSCLNCLNYDRSAHNQCREPQAEWQSDRERANFCDYFIPNKLVSQGNKSATSDTRRAFDDLFKK